MRFEMKDDQIHGLSIRATTERLTTSMLSPEAIESEVAQLKAELDKVGNQMKVELEKPKESLFGDKNTDS